MLSGSLSALNDSTAALTGHRRGLDIRVARRRHDDRNESGENCGNRNEQNRLLRPYHLHLDHGTLVPAKELFDSLERDRIYVPGIARDIGYLRNTSVVGCMKR